MPSSGGQPGGGRPLVLIPSGAGGSGQKPGEEGGIHLGPVRIPKPEDYKVPSSDRQEILKSIIPIRL